MATQASVATTGLPRTPDLASPPRDFPAHAPPQDRLRRAVLLVPVCAALLGVLLANTTNNPPPTPEEVDSAPPVLFALWAALSFGPMLGVILWERIPWMKYRRRRVSLDPQGFRVLGPRAASAGPPREIESVRPVRANGTSFLLLTPTDGGPSWPVEATEEDIAAPATAYRGRPAPVDSGVVRLAYTRKVLADAWIRAWLFLGVALAGVLLSGLAKGAHAWLLLLALCLATALASLICLFLFVRERHMTGVLEISGDACAFVVRHGHHLVRTPISPSLVRGRLEIEDPSADAKARFVLPSGSLSRATQLAILAQLLPTPADPTLTTEATPRIPP